MYKNSNSTMAHGLQPRDHHRSMLLGRVHLAGFPGSQHSFELNLKNVFYASNTELNYKRVTRTHWWWWRTDGSRGTTNKSRRLVCGGGRADGSRETAQRVAVTRWWWWRADRSRETVGGQIEAEKPLEGRWK